MSTDPCIFTLIIITKVISNIDLTQITSELSMCWIWHQRNYLDFFPFLHLVKHFFSHSEYYFLHIVRGTTSEIADTNSVQSDFKHRYLLTLWQNIFKIKTEWGRWQVLWGHSVGFPHLWILMCILRTAYCWFKPHTMAAKLLYNVFCFKVQWYI